MSTSRIPSRRRKAPSLESLVNQCCEDYYFKLNQSFDHKALGPEEKSFSYSQFRDYIRWSHCQENLKFLIEIYHYEKIWNKIFKRQSSILKCKEEAAQQQQSQQQQQRKLSVATIFTTSSRRRHPSIIELPEPEDHDSDEQQHRMDSIHSLDNNDINNLVNELTLPRVVTSLDDIDIRSFVDPNGPHSQEPSFMDTTSTTETGITQSLGNEEQDPLSNTTPLTHTLTHTSSRTNQNWDTLFKPGYQCDDGHECLCNVPSHEHKHIAIPSDTEREGSEEYEYNESVNQIEVRELLKEELAEKFELIITGYVLNNSPYEINLPSDVHNDLVQEYENHKVLYHSPLTLLPAKNAVLQLLRENIYYKFLSEQEKLITKEDSKMMLEEAERKEQIHEEEVTKTSPRPEYSPQTNVNAITTDAQSINQEPTSASVTSATSGPISSISTFLKNHLKHSSSSSTSLLSYQDSTSISSNIQRTQTFAGNPTNNPTSSTTRKILGETTRSLKSVQSTCGLRGGAGHHHVQGSEHSWSKLFPFKKKKSTE